MIATLAADLHERANNAFEQDPQVQASTMNRISIIRRSGANPHCLGETLTPSPEQPPYTMDEVDRFCEDLSASKRCLGLPMLPSRRLHMKAGD